MIERAFRLSGSGVEGGEFSYEASILWPNRISLIATLFLRLRFAIEITVTRHAGKLN